MPLLGTFGAGSGKGYGLTAGAKADPITFDYLVIGGGGNGTQGDPNNSGGSGGAGGMLTSFGTSCSAITLDAGNHCITVGAGGTDADSTFSTITACGGGRGQGIGPSSDGGSGGGRTSRFRRRPRRPPDVQW